MLKLVFKQIFGSIAAKMDAIAAMYKHSFRRQRIFRDRTNPLEFYDEQGVRKRYRLWPHTIYGLCELVEPYMGPKTCRSQALPTLLRVCIGLRFVAVGSFASTVADLEPKVDPATANRTIELFLNTMCEHLQCHIKFKGRTMRTRMQQFFDNYGMFLN